MLGEQLICPPGRDQVPAAPRPAPPPSREGTQASGWWQPMAARGGRRQPGDRPGPRPGEGESGPARIPGGGGGDPGVRAERPAPPPRARRGTPALSPPPGRGPRRPGALKGPAPARPRPPSPFPRMQVEQSPQTWEETSGGGGGGVGRLHGRWLPPPWGWITPPPSFRKARPSSNRIATSQTTHKDAGPTTGGSDALLAAVPVGQLTPERQPEELAVAGPAMPPNKESPGRPGSPAALICLPPISEDLQLVWTQASQTSELDGHQPLRQAFSYFPYPSLADLALLCLRHGLQLERVKAWFMAQRLRCGISWSAEEIEETRARLACRPDRPAFGALLAPGDPLTQTGLAPSGRESPPSAGRRESPSTCSAAAWGEPERAAAAPRHQAKEPPLAPSLYPTPPPLAGASHADAAWDLSKPCRPGAAASPSSAAAAANGAETWARPSPLEATRQRKCRRKTKEQLAVLKSFFLRCQWARREDYLWLEQITGLPRAEIIQWFGDTRYALKHGHLRWFWDNSVPPAPAPEPCADTAPLERYWATQRQLREADLPGLCHESGLGAQQVLDWFCARSPEPAEVVVCLGEDQQEEDEELTQDEGEEEEEEVEEEEELGAQE
ncbi:homeobox and leucine zipper protein Homez isoform X2 [Carettochelys insculpta]|uniref:homeobox and leucine zipper protein Homez isoform X2 n=1 Tax=Carettochelys insculpta TaxID=44489 RepID=UPI003EB81715